MNTIRIYSANRIKLYTMSAAAAESITWMHYFRGLDKVQLVLPLEAPAVGYIEKNGWLVNEDDIPFIVKYIKQDDKTHKATIYAYSPHYGFAKRITRPANGDAMQQVTGTHDAIAKGFINDAVPASGARSLDITVAAARTGTSYTDQTRRKNLGTEVLRVLKNGNLGEYWQWADGAVEFDTYEGTDRTAGNGVNGVCIFAARLGNLQDSKYTLDGTGEVSTVYAAGAGEDTDREIVLVGDSATGWDRNETFLDARDVEPGDTDTLTQRALQAIVDATVKIEAAAADGVNLTYGENYVVGDYVTVQVPVRSYEADGDFYRTVDEIITLDLQIFSVKMVWAKDDVTIDVDFGISTEESGVGGMGSRVSQLEANNAAGGGGGELPVGSLYFNGSDDTNPETLLGYGTWAAFGDGGQAIVTWKSGDADFGTVAGTTGEKTHTLTSTEMPSHNHTQNSHNHTQNSHNHTQDSHNHTQNSHVHISNINHSDGTYLPSSEFINIGLNAGACRNRYYSGNTTATNQATTATNQGTTATNQATTATNQSTGGGGAHNNIQPSIVAYCWIRTA